MGVWTRGRKFAAAVVALLLLLLVVGRLAAEFAVDLWWYESLGLEEVFWTRWMSSLAVRTAAGLLIGGFVFLNLWVVARTLGPIRVRRRYANIEIAERLPQRYVVGVVLLLALFSAWWLSAGVGSGTSYLAFVRAVPWGIRDPVLGHDLSFYVFRFPVFERLQTLGIVLVFWALLLSAAAYVAAGGVRWGESRLALSATARRHLGVLIGCLLLLVSLGLWLNRYALLLGDIDRTPGYTDIHVRLPAASMIAVLGAVAACSVAYGAWKGTLRAPVLGVGTFLLGAALGQGVFPALVQKFSVEPDELAREAPFLRASIRFTLLGYGLEGLERRPLPFQPGRAPAPELLRDALAGAPLWDLRPLLTSYRELESQRSYFNFVTAHYDRYPAPTGPQQVVVSVREFVADSLPPRAQTWRNLHLEYVRGEGVVITPAAVAGEAGRPPRYSTDSAPADSAAIAPSELLAPDADGIYFGQQTRNYAILEQPPGSGSSTARRPIGVPLNTIWRRIAFAWAFQSKNLFLSDELAGDSRIAYRRVVGERIGEITPFLALAAAPDSVAHPVLSGGRVVWLADGYSTSAYFPFSEAKTLGSRLVRYTRNSVKTTVDGLTGVTRMYVIDEEDPVIRTYQRIFPELFRPLSEMPEELRRHLRYPVPMLDLQADVLREYHLVDVAAFYAQEAVWAIPTQIYRDRTERVTPAYAILPLPGSRSPEFLLTIPFVARQRQNMTALLVARNDPPRYGELILFELPPQLSVPGPQQAEAYIDADPEISQQLSLWKQGGSDVVRGNLVLVPVDSTLIYLEPLYLEAEEGAIPQLERVILVAGRQPVMRRNVAGAVAALSEEPQAAEAAPEGAGAPGAPLLGTGEETILRRARELLERAEAELRAGDWSAFGRSWRELNELLRRPPEQGRAGG